jgi:hypothetical protein
MVFVLGPKPPVEMPSCCPAAFTKPVVRVERSGFDRSMPLKLAESCSGIMFAPVDVEAFRLGAVREIG